MARKLRNVEVGREVSFNCGTLLSEQNGGGGGGGDPDTVVTVRLEEETRPDGTVLRRSVISQRPRVSKIWMKNSTNGNFLFRASCDRSVAFSTADTSGFSLVTPESKWAYSYVQQLEPAQSLCYIKVISSDGKQFWDITANLEAADEDAFEIFLQGKEGGGPALRPLPHFGGHSSTSKKVRVREEKERARGGASLSAPARQRRRTMSSTSAVATAR